MVARDNTYQEYVYITGMNQSPVVPVLIGKHVDNSHA